MIRVEIIIFLSIFVLNFISAMGSINSLIPRSQIRL